MGNVKVRALVASADKKWQPQYVRALTRAGCQVNTASNGFEGLDLLQRRVYDLVVWDDSFSDISLLEFQFNLRELAKNDPVTLVAGDDVDRFMSIWKRFNVYFAGPRHELVNKLEPAVCVASRNGKH